MIATRLISRVNNGVARLRRGRFPLENDWRPVKGDHVDGYSAGEECGVCMEGDRIIADAMPYSEMSVYCTCGRIVALDRADMEMKISLGKKLQCMHCRNIRLGREIESLNNHFAGIVEEDETL